MLLEDKNAIIYGGGGAVVAQSPERSPVNGQTCSWPAAVK